MYYRQAGPISGGLPARMNRKALYFGILILMATLIFWPTAEDSGRTRYAIPPKAQVAPLGERGEGPSFSKASDVQLQSLLTSVAPKFALSRFHDLVSGCSITYNIFTPDTLPGRKYPLVLFMADASTPGLAPTYPLTQGLGGLIWADPSWQKKHPCFVVVPQFSGARSTMPGSIPQKSMPLCGCSM